jgi:DNA-binding response OmpR family regulator
LGLTRTKFDLRLLMEGGRRVRDRAQLSLLLAGQRSRAADLVSSIDARTIDVYICNLRRKLRARTHGGWILTLRGAGYRVAAP